MRVPGLRLIVPPVQNLFGPQGRKWLAQLDEETIDPDGLMMIRSDLQLLFCFLTPLFPYLFGQTDIARILLGHGARPDAEDLRGEIAQSIARNQ